MSRKELLARVQTEQIIGVVRENSVEAAVNLTHSAFAEEAEDFVGTHFGTGREHQADIV